MEFYRYISKRSIIVVSYLVIVLLLFVSGCNDSKHGTNAHTQMTLQRTVGVDDDGNVTSEGDPDEVTFEFTTERGEGEPVMVTYNFTTFDSPAEIELYNGGKEEPFGEHVSSAVIVLNGEVIFDESDFNQNVDELEKDITLFPGDNILEVTLNGAPGAKITIEIEQEIEDDGLDDDSDDLE